MPWGIQRLNARKSQPNPNIVFIKPLPGAGEKAAQGFLERIAAQCVPIMRKHHLYVMSLEEYEPNREFVGRNFNSGEVIQLVLKCRRTGRWLPFDYVQMVMMHELAHCKQMNHSRAFWAVRNGYAADMYKLWADGYTGEGIWGRGAKLAAGEWERDVVRGDEALPEHLCGGTFRSRGRKRKSKPTLTYRERKERRIIKKFGRNGVALGADEETKAKLEKGKRTQAKPRVANSARGRELRAAAALARFEQHKEEKTEEAEEEEEEEGDDETGSESDYGDEDARDGDSKDDAFDVDGSRLVDSKGRGMVKVCEDADANDVEARNELDELRHVHEKRRELPGPARPDGPSRKGGGQTTTRIKSEPSDADTDTQALPNGRSRSTSIKEEPEWRARQQAARGLPLGGECGGEARGDTARCGMCSWVNGGMAVTCSMCANVLDAGRATAGTWRCSSATCADSAYANSGDCGVCGLCGQRRGEKGP